MSASKKGSYAPRLFAEEAEAKDAGITQPYLEGAMRRLIKAKRLLVGKSKDKDGKREKAWRLRVVFDFTTITHP